MEEFYCTCMLVILIEGSLLYDDDDVIVCK